MAIPKGFRGFYNGLGGRDKLAFIAYGWNTLPYVPAIALNTISSYIEKFQTISNKYSDIIANNFDPIPALGFGLLNLFEKANPGIGENRYVNMGRSLFGGIYGFSAMSNIIGMFAYDPGAGDFINLTSNSLIAIELLSEVRDSLRRRNTTLTRDLVAIRSDLERLINSSEEESNNREDLEQEA